MRVSCLQGIGSRPQELPLGKPHRIYFPTQQFGNQPIAQASLDLVACELARAASHIPNAGGADVASPNSRINPVGPKIGAAHAEQRIKPGMFSLATVAAGIIIFS